MIGALLRQPIDAVYRRMLDRLHDAGFTDVVAAHFAVLRYPGPAGRRPSELAEDAGMSNQAMNYLLGQLERLDYVTRVEDPTDRRSKRVQLTKRGVAAAKTIRSTVARIEAELEQQLGTKEFRELQRLLVQLNETRFVRGGADRGVRGPPRHGGSVSSSGGKRDR